jgi:hypothetical protein
MRPRTAIIILSIIALIGFSVVFYFIQIRSHNSKQPGPGQVNSVKQLTPAEKKAQTIKLMQEFEKNTSMAATSVKAKEKKKQETTDLMKKFETNSSHNDQ